MVGNKSIYVVYDPKIEDSSSLSKFLGIVLDKAQYPIDLVEFVTLDEYLVILDKRGICNFTICLNKTYSDVSIKYGALLEESTFKFFSRYYQNPDKQIAILGLLMNVSSIFEDDASKKSAWAKLVTFQRFYTDHKDSVSSAEVAPTAPVKEVVAKKAEVAKVVEEVPEVIKDSKEIVAEAIKPASTPKKKLIIKDTVESKGVSPSYEDLLNFYKISSKFLEDFEVLKKTALQLSST